MERLFGAAISTRWKRDHDGQSHAGGSNLLLAEEFDLWWTPQTLPEPGLGQSSVTLSQRFFEQLVEAPVPLEFEGNQGSKEVAVIARSICMGYPARQLFEKA